MLEIRNSKTFEVFADRVLHNLHNSDGKTAYEVNHNVTPKCRTNDVITLIYEALFHLSTLYQEFTQEFTGLFLIHCEQNLTAI